MDTIGALIERNARCYPEREAFVYGERRVTHRQFHERACRLANALHARGLRRQDRIAILAMNCLEYFETESAAEVAGYAVGLINYRLAPPELADVLQDIAPKVLVFEQQYAGAVEPLRHLLREGALFVCIGEPPAWALGFEALAESAEPFPLASRALPDDILYIYYTSGTTGRPKGVPWTQRRSVLSAQICAAVTPIPGNARVLQVTPAFHTGGKGFPLAALWSGATVVLQRAFDPAGMLTAIHSERVTFTFMVAAMLQAVLEVPDFDRYDLSCIQGICSAAAPIPVPLLRQAIERIGPVFSIQYGMTEAGTVACMPAHEVNPDGTPDQVRRLASVGHVTPCIDFRLVDGDDRECAPGQVGEVVIRSPMQLEGYWNNSVASQEAIRDGWYHTGDMGVLDDEHYLYLVDRKKDMIISGGENIYSREVENAILAHPAVQETAVIGVPDARWGERVTAVVVLKPGAVLDEAALGAHCRALIAGYKCPKRITFATELPRTATGKLDKAALRRSQENS